MCSRRVECILTLSKKRWEGKGREREREGEREGERGGERERERERENVFTVLIARLMGMTIYP